MQRFPLSLFGVALLAACGDVEAPASPGATPDPHHQSAAHAVTVFSQNLYIGADVDAVIGALVTPDPDDDLPALLEAIQTLGATDFPTRAGAIADAIAREHPDVIALQEVSTIDIVLPPLGIAVHLDFLDILQEALAARGLDYAVAASVTNLAATPLPGVSTVDQDVVLVNPTRVTVTGQTARTFAANVGPVAPGVSLVRGFAAVTGTIRGEMWTFVSTHLEPDLLGTDLAQLRAAQAAELVSVVAAGDRVVLMGDFNDVISSPMHNVITGAGFADTWNALRPGVTGPTCCHATDLSNTRPTLDARVDYVFARGAGIERVGVQGRIDRFGDLPSDRVDGPQYPIWPSDHAGLLVELLAPPAQAAR